MKVLVAGTFDLFHPGHKKFLEHASVHGDQLFVIVARDISVEQIKGKKPHDSENIRLQNVENIPEVTRAFLGDEKDFLRIPKEINPDILCVGYDQNIPKDITEHLPHCKILYMRPFIPEEYKSSLLRKA